MPPLPDRQERDVGKLAELRQEDVLLGLTSWVFEIDYVILNYDRASIETVPRILKGYKRKTRHSCGIWLKIRPDRSIRSFLVSLGTDPNSW